MSRLDQHVSLVRNKLALEKFLDALAWTTLGLAVLACIAILIDRLFLLHLPYPPRWLMGGLAAAVIAALVYAMMRRPNELDAAVAIDEKLLLKEKFSTALYARGDADPFAQAAVKDAERTADNVSLHKRFPVEFPQRFLYTGGVAVLAVLLAMFVKPLDLFGKQQEQKKQVVVSKQREESKKAIEKALVEVQAQAKTFPNNETIQNAKRELEAMLTAPPKDPAQGSRSAMKSLQDVSEAIKQQIAEDQRFAAAQNDSKLFRSMSPPSDEKGPVADAQRAMAKGDFQEAINQIKQAAEKFDSMPPEQQKQAAQQMKQMAQQLQQMAQNPQQQQAMQQKLQQMGATPQQAQQMQQLMQQAAAGNPQQQQQAQQQLQQMAQQQMQQMNNGQGPNPQQQQQIQQMMQQMQAQMGGQMQAQQMAQAAKQMANAMQQAQANPGQQANNPQQNQQQQQQQQAGQQQMQNAQQQMQQQLQQMQAMQNDMQQMQAAQQAAQAAADAAGQGGQGGGQDQQQQQQQQANGPGGQGEWNAGDPKNQGNGAGGPGQGAGPRPGKQQAPFTFKAEKAPVQDIESGKLLASFQVKAGTLKGESKAELKEVAASAQREQTDEVDQEYISRPAQEAVKKYFGSMEKDAAK